MKKSVVTLILCAVAGLAQAQALPATDTRAVPTYESVGLYWSNSGANAVTGCEVKYRRAGDTAWKQGLAMWFDARNGECRGSLVQLSPGTDYQVEFNLPGVAATRGTAFRTWPNQRAVARTVTVNSGAATLDITEGGSPTGYVVYQGAAGATLDALNASPYNVAINASYVIVRGLKLKGAQQDAIRISPNVTDVIIEDNEISDWGRQRSGIYGVEHDSAIHAVCSSPTLQRVTVQRNEIHDPRYTANSWSDGHPQGPQGVTLTQCGGNHVVRHNEIFSTTGRYFNDIIGGGNNDSTEGFPNADSDIYGNELSHAWDDAIEAEGGNRNVRVWGNYIDQTGTGIASTPTAIGPIYLFRNVYNRGRILEKVPLDQDDRQVMFKAGSYAAFGDGRRYVFHNTMLQATQAGVVYGLGASGGISGTGSGQLLNNTVSRNNIFHNWRAWTAYYDVGVGNEFANDMYNGSAGAAVVSGITGTPIYAAGNGWTSEAGGQYQLASNSPGFDQGVRIANFNDAYTGAAPDVGAHEASTGAMKFGIAASPGSAVASPGTPPPAPAVATVTLASSATPSVLGQSVTFTAGVSGSAGAPTGTVSFLSNGASLAGCSAVTLNGGAAACITSALATGTSTITAAYSGSSTYGASASAAFSQTVNASSVPADPAGSSNAALASAGATASASSTYGAGFPAAAVINNDRAGLNWMNGSGWNDATAGAYPDWVQVNFNAAKTIDRVTVFTLQDNYTAPIEPTDTTTFTAYGVQDFSVQGWNGASWVTLGTVVGNNLVKRTVTFPAFSTDRIRVNVTRSAGTYTHITEIQAWTSAAVPTPLSTNVALASAGGVASASSVYGPGFPVAAVNNNDRAGLNWANGSGWYDGTAGAYPDWVQIVFNGSKTIDRVVVYTLQDNYTAPIEPTEATAFTAYGVQDFTVQGWNGSAWVTLGSVAGNNLVKRTVTFAAFTTDRIRVNITRSAGAYSHLTEVEAWTSTGAPPPASNVALASAGGVASASSVYGPGFPVAAVNNNDRAGLNWANGSGWYDGTPSAYPDWVQIVFNASKTIDRVVVYTLQDNYTGPIEPTDTLTFANYGVQDFTVQGWNGASWVTLGTVTGNNLVKRTVTFAAFATDRIRVNITRSRAAYSHVTEIEAWGK